VPALVAAGRLGQESGRGFFSYENKKKRPQADAEVGPLLKPFVKPLAARPSSEQLTHRLFLPMLVEGTRVLQEGLVRHPRDVDIGMVFGTGFPPFRGGLLFWGDTLGAARVMELLKPLAGLGKRFEPTELLAKCARDGLRLYQVT
jgi:3-hydroxyacyl-CoA dehydrogenase/enoyl-CoA hydratase/3-hydroxybutyryl-CoA epimerase/3-hydroxyacyl-CoA dehydrogenase/enoyl-CoA hydratase/3-hydroxybutyryl-CoA epimerase/enoyl-CoA isomerase